MKHEIAEYIRKLAGTGGNSSFNTFVCKVKSVEGATCTVERVLDELEISEVRLNCHSKNDSGIVVTPKVDSFVLVTSIDGHSHFVSQCSEVDSITIDTESDIKINCRGNIEINGGNNKGLVNIEKLKKNLNTLKAYVLAMKAATISGITAVGASTAANGETGAQQFQTDMASESINFENMEDTKVTH
ncbi:MAG: hypothetical protein IKO34_04910 [Bacteroidales bacterium]|nr:hypothetical protein [Bacteroidales bacterium]